MVKTSQPPATLLWKEWINAFGEVHAFFYHLLYKNNPGQIKLLDASKDI